MLEKVSEAFQPPSIESGRGLHYGSNYGQFSTGGNLHDTFRIDRHENIYGGHTTVDIGKGRKVHMPWWEEV